MPNQFAHKSENKMDFEKARYFMVEQQIRPWNVSDKAVLARLLEVKREDFVPEALKNLALADVALPLAVGVKMLEPKLEARLLQEAQLQETDRVLIVGAGSAYLMALAAGLANHVYGIEIQAALHDLAVANLARAKVRNVTVEVGDGLAGLPAQAPFDAIILTGSVAEVPVVLQEQLALGGRLVAVVGHAPVMQAQRMVCTAPGQYATTAVFEYDIPRLQSAEKTVFQF